MHDRFSCKFDYLRCPLGRSVAVLSGFAHALPFNELFRQFAAVSLLGLDHTHTAGAGILTGLASRTPIGCRLAPD